MKTYLQILLVFLLFSCSTIREYKLDRLKSKLYKVIYIDSTSIKNSYLIKLENNISTRNIYLLTKKYGSNKISKLKINNSYDFDIKPIQSYNDTLSNNKQFRLDANDFQHLGIWCVSMLYEGIEFGEYLKMDESEEIKGLTFVSSDCNDDYIFEGEKLIKFYEYRRPNMDKPTGHGATYNY